MPATVAHLVAIAGPSCSGKTELARWLSRATGAPVLNLDHYYIDLAHLPLEVRAATNFDEPASVDHDAILADATHLRQGLAIHAPQYDFSTHTRAPGDEVVGPAPLVILEGLFALYWPELRELVSLKLFVEAPVEVCLQRRLARDTVERGRTPESVLAQFHATVLPGARDFILPCRNHADLVLSGTDPLEGSCRAALDFLSSAGLAPISNSA
jgi:uridine kinase